MRWHFNEYPGIPCRLSYYGVKILPDCILSPTAKNPVRLTNAQVNHLVNTNQFTYKSTNIIKHYNY